jgi:hypothetical protein
MARKIKAYKTIEEENDTLPITADLQLEMSRQMEHAKNNGIGYLLNGHSKNKLIVV